MSTELRPGRYRIDGLVVNLSESCHMTGGVSEEVVYHAWIESDGIENRSDLIIKPDELDEDVTFTEVIPDLIPGDVVDSRFGLYLAVMADAGLEDRQERQLMLIRPRIPEVQYSPEYANEVSGPLKVVFSPSGRTSHAAM